MAHWNADEFNDDQYAEATLVEGPGSYIYIGVGVRCAASAQRDAHGPETA